MNVLVGFQSIKCTLGDNCSIDRLRLDSVGKMLSKRQKRVIEDSSDDENMNGDAPRPPTIAVSEIKKHRQLKESTVGERVSFPRDMFAVTAKADGDDDHLVGTCEAWSPTRNSFLVVFDEPFEESFDKFTASTSSTEARQENNSLHAENGHDKKQQQATASGKTSTLTLSRLSVAIWNEPDRYIVYDTGDHGGFGGSCTIRKGANHRRACCWWAAWIKDSEYHSKGTKLEDKPVYCVCFRVEGAEPPPPLTSEQDEGALDKCVLVVCETCDEWFHMECAVMVSSKSQTLGAAGAPHDIESSENWKCPLCDGSVRIPENQKLSLTDANPTLAKRIEAWKTHSLSKQSTWRNPLLEWQWWSHSSVEADGEWVFAMATLRRFVNRKGSDEAVIRADPASKAIYDLLNRSYCDEDPEGDEAYWVIAMGDLRKEEKVPNAVATEGPSFTRSSSPFSVSNLSVGSPVPPDLPNHQPFSCSRTRTVEMHLSNMRKKKRKERKKAWSAPSVATTPQPSAAMQSVTSSSDDGRIQRLASRRVASAVGEAALTIGRRRQLRFGRSHIHMWGVFADEPITAGDFVSEYMGELISQKETDRRFAEYMAKGMSDYLFRIDSNLICDATMKGSIARFINHSCEPNCEAKIVTHQNQKKIALYALRDIGIGEELCYDYKFPIEEGIDNKIPCNCGAKRCRKVMN